jgi:hypothetical protein
MINRFEDFAPQRGTAEMGSAAEWRLITEIF